MVCLGPHPDSVGQFGMCMGEGDLAQFTCLFHSEPAEPPECPEVWGCGGVSTVPRGAGHSPTGQQLLFMQRRQGHRARPGRPQHTAALSDLPLWLCL